MNNGYIEIMMPNHPNARSNGTILEHRYVAEQKLGRLLKKNEVVHHLDEIKTHNNPDNLIVFKTNSDHSRFHKIGEKILQNDGTYICPISASKIKKCERCGKYYIYSNMNKNKKYCSDECYKTELDNIRRYKIENGLIPSYEQLLQLIQEKPFTEIGNIFGVTDNAVRKWCKKYNIPYKYRDIHLKVENTTPKRFLLKNYSIKMCSSNSEILYSNYEDAINYIKNNYAKKNTTTRNIQIKIVDAIKHNKKYFGFNWYVMEKVLWLR